MYNFDFSIHLPADNFFSILQQILLTSSTVSDWISISV